MSPMLDEQQPVEQAGFKRSFSTRDHIHTVKQILEKYNEYNKNVYMVFIDYIKAFDSLSHSYVWVTLERQGLPGSFIVVPKRWKEKPWKTVYKMGGRHQNDCWPKVETGNSGQTTVEIVEGGLCQEAH
ncbi:hypothetical protein EVAR_63915_1 [Eumeta japonica]|uniref:Uncharacterized protein n=1 Tax=Eumeta variegata TaxID=151549 RepID=A0A4C2AFG4_EUMVA|nr:hypothetical protein EVAR_63915_1 [Eumeta japonica]